MKTFVQTFPITFAILFSVLTGCCREDNSPASKFQLGDEVTVQDSFYSNCDGVIEDQVRRYGSGHTYQVYLVCHYNRDGAELTRTVSKEFYDSGLTLKNRATK